MITEEQLGNMEAETNSEQEVLKEQDLGHEPNAQDDDQRPAPPPLPPPVPQPLDDERSAVSTSKADEKEAEEEEEEEGECPRENWESTLKKSAVSARDSVTDIEVVAVSTENLGSESENPEALDHQQCMEEGEVVDASPVKEEHTAAPAPHSPRVSLQVDVEAGSLTADENSHVSPRGLSNALAVQDEGALLVSSPSGKKRSKGRPWKKNGGKKKSDREVGELLLGGGGSLRSRDAGTQTDPQELQRNANESDPSGVQVSEDINVRHRAAEGQEQPTLKSSTSEEQVRNEETVHGSEPPSAVLGHEGVDVLEEVGREKVDPSLASFKALRSFGRWADVSEEVETRLTDSEPDSLAIVDTRSSKQGQGQELRGKTDQGFERPQGLDITSGSSPNDPTENEFRGKKQQAVEISPREDVRGSPRSKYTELELRGKSHQGFESPRSRHDLRVDSWNNDKEDLRGKTQQSRDRDSLSQASRESNWRRRPIEPRVRQDMPRRAGKLGFDGDTKKDEHQDFRSRSQYSAEPQATHKNWIPRRGLHSRGEGEGRAEQSKARGKGKQGREAEHHNQFLKDSARQKFEADLRIKQDELLQRSKQSLKAEFQKAKRIEQARKGGDQLEMELNKNLVYEDGELFFLNM